MKPVHTIHTKPWGLLVFCILPVLYYTLYAGIGFCDTDPGFLPALGYRIRLGELPYWNFFYVRPPLSLYIQAALQAIVPVNRVILAGQAWALFTLWGSVFFGSLALNRRFDFPSQGWNIWVFASLAFVVSAHNFPLIPWHTLDGLFFGSLGLWLLAGKGRAWELGLGMLALAAAGLCKQSFWPMIGIGPWMIWGLHSARKAWWVGGITLALLGTTMVLGEWLGGAIWKVALEQMGGSTGDLGYAGFWKYLPALFIYFLPLVGFGYGLTRWKGQEIANRWLGWVGILALGATWIAHAGLALWRQESLPPLFGWTQGLWWVGFGLVIIGYFRRDSRLWILGGLLGLAWCTSISWGYPTPLLAGVPLIFAWGWILHHEWQWTSVPSIMAIFLFLGFMCFGVMRLFPYRDAPRWECTNNLGQLFPEMEGIWTGDEHFNQMREFSALSKKYPTFSVLPALPLAHFLAHARPPLQSTWAHDAELNWSENQSLLLNKGEINRPIIFLQKNHLPELNVQGPYRCSLGAWVRDHCRKMEEGTYFYVYEW